MKAITAMTVLLGLALAGPMLAQEGTAGSPPGMRSGQGTGPHQGMPLLGAHDMTGTVTNVNHQLGLVNFKTPQGVLRLYFPPTTIRSLRAGDTITVYLGYEPGSGTHGKTRPGMLERRPAS